MVLQRVGDKGINYIDLVTDLKFHRKHVDNSFSYLRGLGYNVVEFKPGWWRIDGCLW